MFTEVQTFNLGTVECVCTRLSLTPFSWRNKTGIRTRAKCADSDHPAIAQSPVRAFALHSYILKYPIILLANNRHPDLTARMRWLIWTFAVRICQRKRFCMARPKLFFYLINKSTKMRHIPLFRILAFQSSTLYGKTGRSGEGRKSDVIRKLKWSRQIYFN